MNTKRVWLVVLGITALFGHAAAEEEEAEAEASQYGQTLIVEYQLPRSVLAKFAAFEPSEAEQGVSMIEAVMLADTEEWIAAPFHLYAAGSPYTIVVTLSGTAIEDGDAATMWQAGWQLANGMSRLNPLPGLAKPSAAAGESFSVTVATKPTTFREDQSVSAVIGLVNARNIQLDSVTVAIWAGVGEPTTFETLRAYRLALVGAVFLIVGGFFYWWRTA